MDGYLARGFVWCGLCSRVMVAVRHLDATRAYSCGLYCPQRDLAALPLEQDLLLRALVRAHATLYGVGRHGPRLVVSAEEVRRWQWCDLSDRRAVLHAAFVRVVVDPDGEVNPVWRHETEAIPGAAADDQ
ncbi:MAG: hypothetical protein ACRD0P_11310 [Stackebrandtia sp.]